MDYNVSHIQVAGAGAGKTYGLADRIIKRDEVVKDHKVIFAITYTNAAKKNITEQLCKQMGVVPNHIRIMTVHSFLLEKIIFPYSNIVLKQSYKKAISIPLSDIPQFKAAKLKRINDRNIIHNQQVFKKAQMILNKNRKSKELQGKIDIILNHIVSGIDSIFVDESQDLDNDALMVFEFLAEQNIYLYMVGDPKQAIKYPKAFESFCLKVEKGGIKTFALLDCVNSTRRVPELHLKLSNCLCKKNQLQNSLSQKQGRLSYLFVTDNEFTELYSNFKLNESLMYISKKNDLFDTHLNTQNIYLPESVKDKLEKLCKFEVYNLDIWIESILIEFEVKLEKMSPGSILKQFESSYGIKLERNEWAELKEILTKKVSKQQYNVSSIDKIKGLESESCLFIVNNSMLQYLTGKNKTRNKEMNRLYVALTRSLDHLIFAIDIERINCMNKCEIQDWFESRNIDSFKSS